MALPCVALRQRRKLHCPPLCRWLRAALRNHRRQRRSNTGAQRRRLAERSSLAPVARQRDASRALRGTAPCALRRSESQWRGVQYMAKQQRRKTWRRRGEAASA